MRANTRARSPAVNYPWFKYIPTPSVITGGGGTYGQGDYVTAATADDKSFLVAYLPVAGPITIDPTSLGASKVTATWFDPATGASTPVAGSPFSGTQSISLPAPPSSDGDMAVAIVPVGNAPPPSSKGAALPGILRVAQYDEGGEGVAYHDRDTTNLMSSTYRPGEGVDSDGSSVGWIYAGEWLAYTVSVSTSGTYDFAVPMSHPGPGGILHFDVDGANASGVVNIPNSGDWDTYATVHVAVPLTGGEHLLKVIFDTNGSTGAGPGLRDIVVTAQLPPNSQPGCPFAGALRGPNGLVVDGNGVILAQPSASVASEVWSLSGGALRSQGSCLGMGATYDGAALQRLPCASVATQQWSFQSDGTVRSSDNRCVSVAYADPSAGRQLVIWPCVGHVTQTSWSLCP